MVGGRTSLPVTRDFTIQNDFPEFTSFPQDVTFYLDPGQCIDFGPFKFGQEIQNLINSVAAKASCGSDVILNNNYNTFIPPHPITGEKL